MLSLALSKDIVPSEWKLAKAIPVYKSKGSVTKEGNYRPVFILPHISILLEKAIHDQLSNYLIEHSVISVDQSAFRKLHSTQS